MKNARTEFTPALNEVVMSVNFKDLDKLNIMHLSELVKDFSKEGFSKFQEGAIVQPMAEPVEPQQIALNAKVDTSVRLPRILITHFRGNKIIQIQRDRFTFNHRKYGSYEHIPSYQIIFQDFKRLYDKFTKFISNKQIGLLDHSQYELTYVYNTSIDDNMGIFSNIDKICNLFNGSNIIPFWNNAKRLNLSTLFQMDQSHNWIFLNIHNNVTPDKKHMLRIDFRLINFEPVNSNEMHEWFNSAYNEIIKKSESLSLYSN